MHPTTYIKSLASKLHKLECHFLHKFKNYNKKWWKNHKTNTKKKNSIFILKYNFTRSKKNFEIEKQKDTKDLIQAIQHTFTLFQDNVLFFLIKNISGTVLFYFNFIILFLILINFKNIIHFKRIPEIEIINFIFFIIFYGFFLFL